MKLKKLLFEDSETTLRQWLPRQFFTQFTDSFLNKILDYTIVEEYGFNKGYKKHPFPFKNIHTWCVVTNGIKKYAAGWNESPSIGWSFPYKRLK